MTANQGRWLFIALALGMGLLNYSLIARATEAGRAFYSVPLVIAASPVVMLLTWGIVQRGQPSLSGVTLANVSWSAASDLIILTSAVWLATAGWARYGAMVPKFFKSPEWTILAFVIGLLLGLLFHVMGGQSVGLHDSATSWMHNLGVFPALAGTLLRTILPLFFTEGWKWSLGAVLLVLVWFGLAVADGIRANLDITHPLHFNPNWLDTFMNWARWRPARR